MAELLPLSFYASEKPVEIAHLLLGKVLITNIDNEITSGIIVETEAYVAPEDRASHAYQYKRSKKNEQMYGAPGSAYVYICYGIHNLFNVITGPIDTPHAVLIRAIEPLEGVEIMLKRRALSKMGYAITSGPGSLSKALGIQMEHNDQNLRVAGEGVWIEDRNIIYKPEEIVSTPRIGVESSGDSAQLRYRFIVKRNPYLSARSFSKKYY